MFLEELFRILTMNTGVFTSIVHYFDLGAVRKNTTMRSSTAKRVIKIPLKDYGCYYIAFFIGVVTRTLTYNIRTVYSRRCKVRIFC
jgi:hypothetical protein